MFCPKCGVNIHPSASFCAKCGKNILYLREIETTIPLDIPNEAIEGDAPTPMPAVEVVVVPVKRKWFQIRRKKKAKYYCNFCGTGIVGGDNYCYQCGKLLLKAYFWSRRRKTPWYLGAGFAVSWALMTIFNW
jgi:predicted amidophosphoribosyltransferase